MDEFCLVTVVSNQGETEAEFNKRLIAFWSHMLRTQESAYETVYAEATRFQSHTNDRVSRQYFVAVETVPLLHQELATHGLASEPTDEEDVYSRYEATPPDWFQIEH